MFGRIQWVALGAFVPLVACGGSSELIEATADGVDIEAASDDSSNEASPDGSAQGDALELGQTRQAQIDTRSDCFGNVPPFVQPGDFFQLTAGESFVPRSLCGEAVFFFMVENLVKDLGIPFIRPFEAPAENCADLQVFFAIGQYDGDNERPTIIAEGSKRGRVIVRDSGVLFCDISLPLQPSNLNRMPDGEDYIFVVQALDDDSRTGFSEQVLVSNPSF